MTEDSNHKKISTEEQASENASENINKDISQSSKQFKEKTTRSTADLNNKLPIILSTIALACGIYSVSITSNLNNLIKTAILQISLKDRLQVLLTQYQKALFRSLLVQIKNHFLAVRAHRKPPLGRVLS